MLLAVFADIHANRQAFGACLAAARIRDNGLPTWLADRLTIGR